MPTLGVRLELGKLRSLAVKSIPLNKDYSTCNLSHKLGQFSQYELLTDKTANCFSSIVLFCDRAAFWHSKGEEVLGSFFLKIRENKRLTGFGL